MTKLLKANDDGDDETENSSSSAHIVASIDDLLVDIIQRLPLKSLVQLRLVSKYWNSLILDPKFCLLRNRPAVGLIFKGIELGHGNIWYTIFLDKSFGSLIREMTPIKDTSCKIWHSCNGLLLCASTRAHYRNSKYYVCNPTTRKYIALPDVVFDHTRMTICGMYLAFDPSKSPHYRVVCVLRSFADWLLFKVYSSETGSWRNGVELFKPNADFDSEDGVYWNGAIHWVNIVTAQESIYYNLDCDKTIKVFQKPPLQDKCYDRYDYYFGESSDHLHFVDAYRELDEYIVYEMKRDYSEWFVKYKVKANRPEMKRDYSEWLGKYRIYVHNNCIRYNLVRGKNDDDSFLVIVTGKKIARYNLEQKTWETMCEFEPTIIDQSIFRGSKRPFQYIESICSV